MLESPDPAPPDLFGTKRSGRRLRDLTLARLEPGEEVVATNRVWLSRDGRFNPLLAARTPCFAVVTKRRVMCWSVGFFSRRPRHRVLTDRLDDLRVVPIGKGSHPLSRLRVQAFARKPVRFDFRRSESAEAFAQTLCDAVTETPVTSGLPEAVPAPPPPPPAPGGVSPEPTKESRWQQW